VNESLETSLSGSLEDYNIHTSNSGLQISAEAKKPYQERYRSAEKRLSALEKDAVALRKDAVALRKDAEVSRKDAVALRKDVERLKTVESILLQSQIFAGLLSSKLSSPPILQILSLRDIDLHNELFNKLPIDLQRDLREAEMADCTYLLGVVIIFIKKTQFFFCSATVVRNLVDCLE
jgi:hypothetical protein